MLSIDSLHVSYGGRPGGARGLHGDPRRQGRRRPRQQRRRQDDAAAHPLRARCGCTAAGSSPGAVRLSTATTSRAATRPQTRRHGPGAGARGAADLQPAHRRGEPPRRRAGQPGHGGEGQGAASGSTSCSRSSPSAAPQRGGLLSGGEQQMLAMGRALMARPEAAAARRALAGPRAAHHRPDRRGHPRDQPAGHLGPARRAERDHGARRRRHRLRPRRRRGVAVRRRPPSWPQSDDVQRLYLGHGSRRDRQRPAAATGARKKLTRWTA